MSVISFENVSKKYHIGSGRYHSLREDLSILFKRFLFGGKANISNCETGQIWALKNVSFKVEEGETLGIIGPNGAGKSTILKLLSKITLPTEGKISVSGKIAPLIEITAGLHPELTGKENIYFNASVMGMKKSEIDLKFDEIVEFAEIQRFIDTPVKRYSSGMMVRLGYAVIANLNPDIMLIDEVLSVGDMSFQRKCLNNMNDFKKKGKSIVFVSHNLSAVRGLCDKVIWLDKGEVRKEGDPGDVINAYTSYMTLKSQFVNDTSYIGGKTRWGTGEARFTNVEVLNSEGVSTNRFHPGEDILIRLEYEAVKRIDSPTFWVGLMNKDEIKVFGSYYNKDRVGEYYINGKGLLNCVINSQLMRPGIYYVMAGIYGELGDLAIDRIGKAAEFEIESKFENDFKNYHGYGAEGAVNLHHRWEFI